MNYPFALGCMFSVLLVADETLLADDIDASLRDRFLEAVREVPWKSAQVSFRAKCVSTTDYQSISKSQRERCRKRNEDPDKPETTARTVAFRGPMALTMANVRSGERVQCKNTEYAFQIGRPSAARAYSLSFIEQLGGVSDAAHLIREAEIGARAFPFGGWHFSGNTLADLVASPNFRIKHIAAEDRDGAKVVRMGFHWKDQDPGGRSNPHSDSYMVCDPAIQWAMKEYGSTAHNGDLLRTMFEYGDRIDGVAVAKKVTHLRTIKDDKGELSVWRIVTAIEVTADDVPREEFYLSHYGLPEPNFRRGWFGAWVWYLIAGVVCIGVAELITKFRRTRVDVRK